MFHYGPSSSSDLKVLAANCGPFAARTILTGLGRVAESTLVNTPELREMRDQTMLFVFGL